MLRKFVSVCAMLLALAPPAIAAIDAATGPMYMGQAAGDFDQWRRIDFRSAPLPSRRAAQIKVAIQTKGLSIEGLIRIPGAPASNFNTGKGVTVVDLINVGNEATGYAEIVALEILFTQTRPGQFFEIFAVERGDETK